jgi:hypothetical protein
MITLVIDDQRKWIEDASDKPIEMHWLVGKVHLGKIPWPIGKVHLGKPYALVH